MNAIEMIRAQLAVLGADGLCNSDAECGCSRYDLAPCFDGISRDCVAARKTETPEGCDPTFGDDWYAPMDAPEHAAPPAPQHAETHFRDEHNAD